MRGYIEDKIYKADQNGNKGFADYLDNFISQVTKKRLKVAEFPRDQYWKDAMKLNLKKRVSQYWK